jgi:hypothetical protein
MLFGISIIAAGGFLVCETRVGHITDESDYEGPLHRYLSINEGQLTAKSPPTPPSGRQVMGEVVA